MYIVTLHLFEEKPYMTVISEYILNLSTGNTATSTADGHMDAGKLSDHQLRYNVYTVYK